MSVLVRSLTRPGSYKGNDVTRDTASICDDRRGLLRSSALPKDEPGLQISEIAGAQLLHGDRLVIELSVLDGIIAPSDASQLHLCLSACRLGRPGSMKPNCVSTRATTYSILDDVAALAGTKDPQTEAWQFVVPDQVVLFLGFRRLDNPLRDLDHDVPSFRARSLA